MRETKDSIPNIVVPKDVRGRLIWRNPEFSIDQLEQLGVANIQYGFIAAFPEFLQNFSFNENGTICIEKIEEARVYITAKLGNSEKFNTLYGRSPTDRKVAPYFEGSHIVAVIKSFAPWGIEIKRIHLAKKNSWSDYEEEERLEALREEASTFYNHNGAISYDLLKEKSKGLLKAIYKYYPGGLLQLEADMNIGFGASQSNSTPHEPLPAGHWSKERISEAALTHYAEYGKLSQTSLINAHDWKLRNAIRRHYGKITLLLEELGLDQNATPHKYWSTDRIEEVARKIYIEEKGFNYILIRKLHQYGLIHGIYTNYPGGMRGLQEKLGIQINNPANIISSDAADELLRSLPEE